MAFNELRYKTHMRDVKDKVRIHLSETEWKEMLPDKTFHIMRKNGTEYPFTGSLLHNKEKGTYHCAGCGLLLFSSDAKYNAGSGWLSFFAPIKDDHIATATDERVAMTRMQANCPRCGGHLGHIFDDGPQPTGKRYCINSAALLFEKSKEKIKKEQN